jgi:hypothetical protein
MAWECGGGFGGDSGPDLGVSDGCPLPRRESTILALKSGYHLDGGKITVMPMVDDISTLACEVTKGDWLVSRWLVLTFSVSIASSTTSST